MIPTTPTILIVDDVPFNVQLLANLLEKRGYAILTANGGKEAREYALKHKPDMILLDILMPEEDGFETCMHLKEDPTTADIPVIFISSATDSASKIKGLSIGGLDYITKPFDPPEVLARVRNYLKLHFSYSRVIEEQAKRLQQVQDAQQAILVKPADITAANFMVHYRPILEAGGDFYDVFQITKNTFGYLVADVAGHNLGTSLATSALKALVQVNTSSLYEPEETMSLINRVLAKTFSNGQHLTAIYCHYDRSKRELSVVNSGHLPLLIVSQEGDIRQMNSNSDIVGAFANGLFKCDKTTLNEGDRFFLFTDGLLESSRPMRTRDEGLTELINNTLLTMGMPLETAVTAISRHLFVNNRPPEDDVLLLGVDA